MLMLTSLIQILSVSASPLGDARNEQLLKRWPTTKVSLDGVGGGGAYALNADIGGQIIPLALSLAYSSVFVTSSNFTCGATVTCSQGSSAFDPSASTAFADLEYANNFNVILGFGPNDTAQGYGGTDTVTVSDIPVDDTTIGVLTQGYFLGGGAVNGFFGLGGPLLSYLFSGDDYTTDSPATQIVYESWFAKAVDEGYFQPSFSLVLDRTTLDNYNTSDTIADLGTLYLGDQAPDVPVTNATVTVQNVGFPYPVNGTNITLAAYWTITADSLNFPGSDSINTTLSALIDPGTFLHLVRDDIADAYNALWEPPSTYDNVTGFYYIDCSSPVPDFSVTIGGVTFTQTAEDARLPAPPGVAPGACVSTITRGGPSQEQGFFILGARLLVNLVSTFDTASNEITLSQRQPYVTRE